MPDIYEGLIVLIGARVIQARPSAQIAEAT